MSKSIFKVNISPEEAYEIIKKTQDADLVHEEIHQLDDEKCIATLVFEKYFIRAGNRAALVVIFDNIKGHTEVRSVATGSSTGIFLNFDWGASDDFADSVKNILSKYIIK